MSATAVRSAVKTPTSSHGAVHSSHTRKPSQSRSSTTPRATLPAPSVGQTHPPRLTTPAQQPNMGKQSSPSYFGFVVSDNSNPPDSNPGDHAKQNWNDPATTPRGLPLHEHPEFEAFRRQSESKSFSLGQSGFANQHRPSGSRSSSKTNVFPRKSSDSPISPSTAKDNYRSAQIDTSGTSFFDLPRADSPGLMSPAQHAIGNTSHHARLSLPGGQLQTPPLQDRAGPRADTLPHNINKNGPTLATSTEYERLINDSRNKILLLDLRVSPQYAHSRIKGALNLCIPTTLLKRPAFNVAKLEDTFANEDDRERFSEWEDCTHIVVYDATSATLKDAITAVHVLKKFATEGWRGTSMIIKGGFAACAKMAPKIIDKTSASASRAGTRPGLSLASAGPAGAPVAGGCPMPSTKNAANPFFGNIRQNMDLIGGVGQIPISKPSDLSDSCERSLPQWLRRAASQGNQGKLVSDKFLTLEKDEQQRMQQALSGHVSYGTPGPSEQRKVQVAGIEKGSKNRYNNIFPYDHSRVRLQSVSEDKCDYINASYVKASRSNRRYIATQAPIPATFQDFWKLVWEQDVRVVVMLTAEREGGQVKSHAYWNSENHGPFRVKKLSERIVSLETTNQQSRNAATTRPSLGQRRSTNPPAMGENSPQKSIPSAEAPSVVVRHLTLSHSSHPFEKMREITQLHYSQWPDFGAPTDPRHLLSLIDQTDKCIHEATSPSSQYSEDSPAPRGQRPVIVHCSAGCGRTGTFCTIDSVVDMLKRQKQERASHTEDSMEIDGASEWLVRDDVDLVAKTVEDFRDQRLSMVQNLKQFVLCYEAVLLWLASQDHAAAKEDMRRSYHG